MTESNAEPTVLVVDDESEVADVYALRLRDEYETETAYGGQEALERVDDDVDVVLLDRRMPDLSGDDVLTEVRERGYDCRVIMTTAVEPDFDIVEMPFDDYLTKPVEKADIVDAIERQLQASQYDDRLTEYLEVSSKLALLETEKATSELEDSEEIDQLRERAQRLREDLDETLAEFDDPVDAFREIGRD